MYRLPFSCYVMHALLRGRAQTPSPPLPSTPGHSGSSPGTQPCRSGQLGRGLGGPQSPQIVFHHTQKSIHSHHKLWLGPSSPALQPFDTNKICSPTNSGPTKPMACSEMGNSKSA